MTDTNTLMDPTFIVGVPGMDATLAYDNVLRLGSLDPAVEGTLGQNAGNLTDQSAGWNTSGILLFSTDKITTVAPEVTSVVQSKTEWSSGKLEITTAWDGTTVQSAEYSFNGGKTAYTLAATVEVVNGMGTALTTGIETKAVVGIGSVLTFGSEMKSVVGTSIEFLAGVKVAFENNEITVQGPDSSVAMHQHHVKSSGGTLALNAGSVAATGAVAATGPLTVAVLAINVLTNILNEMGTVGTGIAIQVDASDLSDKSGSIQDNLVAQFAIAETVASALVIAQVLALVTASIMTAADQTVPGSSSINMAAESIMMSVGDPAVGAALNLVTPTGYVDAIKNLALAKSNLAAEQQNFDEAGSAYDSAVAAGGTGMVAFDAMNQSGLRLFDGRDAVANAAAAVAAFASPANIVGSATIINLTALTSLTLTVGETILAITAAGIEITAPALTYTGANANFTGATAFNVTAAAVAFT